MPAFTIRLKTLVLSMILLGFVIESSIVVLEKIQLGKSSKFEANRINMKSNQYVSSRMNGMLIRIILTYFISFTYVYFFRQLSARIKTQYNLAAVIFITYRVVIEFLCNYYDTFVSETKFNFNIIKMNDFVTDFFMNTFVDCIIYTSFIIITSLFNRQHTSSSLIDGKSIIEEDNINIELNDTDLDKLNAVEVADEDIENGRYPSFQRNHWVFPIAVFSTLVCLLVVNAIVKERINGDYRLCSEPPADFNESIDAFILTDKPFFRRRVHYGVSKKTLHSEMRAVGFLKPDLIFSLNIFYYVTSNEAVALGPVARSMLESKDNLLYLFLDILRAGIYAILLFGICKAGADDFASGAVPDIYVNLFLAFTIFLTVDSVFGVFVNGIYRNTQLRHECAAFKVGFPIREAMTKLARKNAIDFTPTASFKLMYMRGLTADERNSYAMLCPK